MARTDVHKGQRMQSHNRDDLLGERICQACTGKHPSIQSALGGWTSRDLPSFLSPQGVHAVFDGTPGKPWKAGERHRSRMVFIGRDLDERILREGFTKCLV